VKTGEVNATWSYRRQTFCGLKITAHRTRERKLKCQICKLYEDLRECINKPLKNIFCSWKSHTFDTVFTNMDSILSWIIRIHFRTRNFWLHTRYVWWVLTTILFIAQQPLVAQSLLIIEASGSHSDTPHSIGSSGRVMGLLQ